MSLNWSVAYVRNYKELTSHPARPDEWSDVTFMLAMLALPCGYDRITEANYRKVAARIETYQLLVGAALYAPKVGDIYITEEDVHDHIGMTINATPMTDAQFAKAALHWNRRHPGQEKSATKTMRALAAKLQRNVEV